MNDNCNDEEKQLFNSYYYLKDNCSNVFKGIQFLIEILYRIFKKEVIIIGDSFDRSLYCFLQNII